MHLKWDISAMYLQCINLHRRAFTHLNYRSRSVSERKTFLSIATFFKWWTNWGRQMGSHTAIIISRMQWCCGVYLLIIENGNNSLRSAGWHAGPRVNYTKKNKNYLKFITKKVRKKLQYKWFVSIVRVKCCTWMEKLMKWVMVAFSRSVLDTHWHIIT